MPISLDDICTYKKEIDNALAKYYLDKLKLNDTVDLLENLKQVFDKAYRIKEEMENG